MNSFESICRNLGLMLHNIKHPETPAGTETKIHKEEIARNTETKQIDAVTTLRRTTIDEIEIKKKP